MNIKAISHPINFQNRIRNNQPNLNCKIQESISFLGKNKAKITSPRANYPDMLSAVDIKKTKTIRQLQEAYKRGEDIEEDREKLILSRIPVALKSAEKFTKEHPEFDIEDIGQDLIRIAITATDSELHTQGRCQNFGTAFYNLKDRYFSSILGKETKKSDPRIDRFIAIKMEEMMPEEVHVQLEQKELNEELKADFMEALSRLKPQYKEIIIKRFGLDGNEPMTLEEIGNESSSTRQNIRQNGICAMRDFKKAYLNIQKMRKMGGNYED